jgi:palmitoyltransferase ZDHHC4
MWTFYLASISLGFMVLVLVLGPAATPSANSGRKLGVLARIHRFLVILLPEYALYAARRLLGIWLYGRVASCFAWLTTARHPLVQLFYITLLTVGVGIFAAKGWPRIIGDPAYLLHAWLVVPISILGTAWSFYRACTLEPHDNILFPALAKECSTCKLSKPARSKHCSVCGYCVLRCDHHCAWINACVGAGNHGAFLQFLASTTWICAYGAWLILNMYVKRLLLGFATERSLMLLCLGCVN